jgi:hypothetical protein
MKTSRLLLAALLLQAASVFANTTVDIFIAYTPAARNYAGGDNAMIAAINAHVALTNT